MKYKKRYHWNGKGSLTMNSEPKVAMNRRRMAPLMPEEAKATASIHALSYDFAYRITRLSQYLTEAAEYKEYVQSKQVCRCGIEEVSLYLKI